MLQGDLLLAAAGPSTVVNKALDRVRGFLGENLGEVDPSAPPCLLWVTDFPLFEYNDDQQRLEVGPEYKFFTTQRPGNLPE